MRNYSQKLVNYFAYFVKENMSFWKAFLESSKLNKLLNIFSYLSRGEKKRNGLFLEHGSSFYEPIPVPFRNQHLNRVAL